LENVTLYGRTSGRFWDWQVFLKGISVNQEAPARGGVIRREEIKVLFEIGGLLA
jgi:hypothetical protein